PHRDRMEGLPQPRLRGAEARVAHAGDLRRAQPLRARGGARARPGVPRHRARGAMSGTPALPDFSAVRVLVAGDVMLDRYWFGDVHRISPEAPVPVVHVQRTEERPGGAANVARNITALEGRCTLLSVAGNDEAAASLERLLAADRVQASLHRDPALSTTVKLRVV